MARVIGCSNPEVGESLVHLYRRLTCEDVRYVGKVEVAEATKVIENVQRDINIALVNELAQIFPELDLDVEDVLSSAATKWNFHRYTPGIGVGGHCIPVDPYYMMQRAQEVGVPAELITAARAVNRMMPRHVSGVLRELLYRAGVPADDGRVLFLGWSYKAGVGDARETPADPLSESLIESGISVSTWIHISPLMISQMELMSSRTLRLRMDSIWWCSQPRIANVWRLTGRLCSDGCARRFSTMVVVYWILKPCKPWVGRPMQ